MEPTKTTATKAWVAAIGTVATAIATTAATVQVVLGDDKIDMGEYGTIAVAVATLVTTIYGVWKAENKPKP